MKRSQTQQRIILDLKHLVGSLVLAALMLLGSGAAIAEEPRQPVITPSQKTLDQEFLYEIVRHVYRWYLDENDVDKLSGVKTFPFWVRHLDVPLDADDHSEMVEIIMPLVGTSVKVKRSDYRIAELNLTVKSDTFKITQVSKIGIPTSPDPEDRIVNVDYAAMKDYLFQTRALADYPKGALLDHLRQALRKNLKLQPGEFIPGQQIVHLAPLSPVANEVFVFWENRNLLIRFASDIDLNNPAVWEQEALIVRTWDVYNQVVVSLDEAAGSNVFLTRDQIGRALYNTIVLGQRLEIVNPEADHGVEAKGE